MAERSKAPDSSLSCLCYTEKILVSKEARVRIALQSIFFCPFTFCLHRLFIPRAAVLAPGFPVLNSLQKKVLQRYFPCLAQKVGRVPRAGVETGKLHPRELQLTTQGLRCGVGSGPTGAQAQAQAQEPDRAEEAWLLLSRLDDGLLPLVTCEMGWSLSWARLVE